MNAAVGEGRGRVGAPRRSASRGLRAWSWTLAQAALLSAGSVLVLILLADPNLRAKDVRVQGLQHLTSTQVTTALALPNGRSIFLLHRRSLEARLRTLAWVRSAEVTLALPDHLTVRVREWGPVAVFQQGERSYYLGERGTILGPAEEAGVLPLVERRGLAQVREGAAVVDPALLQLLLPLSEGFPRAFRLKVSAFSLDERENLVLRTDRGFTIVLGEMATAEERATLEPKLAALQALAAKVDLVQSPILYINLMNPRTPAVQMRGR